MNRSGTATSDRRRKLNKEILRGLKAEPGEGSTLAAHGRKKCLKRKDDWCSVFRD